MNLKNTLKKNSHKIVEFSLLILVIFFILLINDSFAGTDGQELKSTYDKLVGLVSGIGGKIVALISGVLGLIGCAIKFNVGAVLTFFGVAIGVGTVSTIVDTTVTCLLTF